MKAGLLAGIALIACSARAASPQPDYRVEMDIVMEGGCAVAIINFHNSGNEPMYFEPAAPAINVYEQKHRQMPYVGIIAEYPPLTVDDYIKVLPGKSFTRRIALVDYRVTEKGDYSIEASAGYFDPVAIKLYDRGMLRRDVELKGQCLKPAWRG